MTEQKFLIHESFFRERNAKKTALQNGFSAKNSTPIFVKFLYYILPGALFFHNSFAEKSRPPKGGSTREAGLEKRQQRSEKEETLVPLFFVREKSRKTAKKKLVDFRRNNLYVSRSAPFKSGVKPPHSKPASS